MKLSVKRTIFIGLAFLSISAFWNFYDQVIPYMLEYSFGGAIEGIFGAGTRTIVTNIIMSFDNVFALFLLPLFGTLSDKTRTAFGKRTPYIMGGTAMAVGWLALLGFAENLRVFSLFFVCLLFLLLSMSIYRSPAVALMPDLTPRNMRSRANAIINLMGTVGGAIALVAIMIFVPKEKLPDGTSVPVSDIRYFPVIIAIAGIMTVAIVLFFLLVRERKWADEMPYDKEEAAEMTGKGRKMPRPVRRSLIFILLSVALWYMAYNGITTALSRYCHDVLEVGVGDSAGFTLIAMVSAAIAFVPIGLLSALIGRKKMIYCGIVLMFTCFVGGFFVTASVYAAAPFLLYVLFAAVGIGWAAINVNSFPMVVELAGVGDVGKYTGYYYTFSMAAQVFTPILSGALIGSFGYRILFPYAAIFMLLAFMTMLMVRHGDIKAPISAAIESYEVD